MKYGITNAKGGGGSLTIPIITILATQQETSVLPDINYLLTQEQIDAFNNNNIVEVILPDGTDYLYQANITSDTIQWGIKVFQKVIVGTDATGDFASSKSLVFITDNITINETTIRAGKQLYQHNVSLNYSSGNKELKAFFTITNDSDQALTYQNIYDYLDSLNIEYNGNQYNKLFGVNGRYENTSPTPAEYGNVFGMYINTQNEGYIRFAYMKTDGSVSYLAFKSATIYDFIKAL